MTDNYIRNVIEAALLAAARPLPLADLALLFEESDRPDTEALRTALAQLEADLRGPRHRASRRRRAGFACRCGATWPSEVARLWPERPQRYSRALLETLVADRLSPADHARRDREHPRRRRESEHPEDADRERNWIRVVGHRDVPGPSGTARHDARFPRLLRPEGGSTSCRRWPTSRRWRTWNLQLPLPQLDAADGTGVFVPEPDSPTILNPLAVEGGQDVPDDSLSDLADDAAAGDDDNDSPTQQASGETAPGLVAAPPRDD
jgi:hypothetical protein